MTADFKMPSALEDVPSFSADRTTPDARVILPAEATEEMLFDAAYAGYRHVGCTHEEAEMLAARRLQKEGQNEFSAAQWGAVVAAAPNSGRVTAEMLEAAARAICELDIRQARQFDTAPAQFDTAPAQFDTAPAQFDTAPARLEEMLTAAVNHAWDAYIDDARAAFEAIGLTVER